MLMSDGPYEGNIEGAKRQVENIEKIMAENEKRRNENSSALPSERNRDLKYDFLVISMLLADVGDEISW